MTLFVLLVRLVIVLSALAVSYVATWQHNWPVAALSWVVAMLISVLSDRTK